MKAITKRSMAYILAFVVLISGMSGVFYVSAEGTANSDETAGGMVSGSCGENLTWTLDTESGVLKISGAGEMDDFYKEYVDGSYRTTAPWNEHITDIKSVVVDGEVTTIGDYAFYNCESLTNLALGDSVVSIGDSAFYYCSSLISITIPDSVTHIDTYAFSFCKSLVNVRFGKNVTVIGNLAFWNCSSLQDVRLPETVTSIGLCVFMQCTSLESITVPVSVTTIGSSAFFLCPVTIKCAVNSYAHQYAVENDIEFELISVEPTITIENYTVTITGADYIKDMRYALGEYTTTTEVRNAEGNVALDNGVVVKNTVDGKFVYEMPDGGMYSIWIRMKDGTNYVLPLDMTHFTPSVSTYGVKVTVDGLYDAKDFFIAKGKFDSYNEIKNNGYIVRVTEGKMAGKHSYTYTVSEPGMHTVLVRYNDGTSHIFHEELTVDEPTFTVNGLQVTVGNIPDVKVIRTAYGEWNTPGEVKNAPGARNFSNKAVIKNTESYMLQYREEGMVTIVVEYNNGYVKVFHHNIEQKRATMEQDGNRVIFSNLKDSVMIRYAESEYNTMSEIKASGKSIVQKTDVTSLDGKIGIELTEPGTYTFCVQFNDESLDYYRVVVD